MSKFSFFIKTSIDKYFKPALLLLFYEKTKRVVCEMISRAEMISPKEKKLTQRILNEFKKTGISIGIISFLIARAGIMDNMTPFGISFLISYLLKDVSIIIPIILSAGVLTVHGLNGYMYIVSIFAIYIVYNKFLKNKKGVSVAKVSLFSSGIFLGFKILNIIILNNYYIYDFFLAVFESLVVFTLSYVFSYSIPTNKSKNTKLSNEEIICTFVTLALALSGINELSIFGISFKNIFSILIVLIFGYKFGSPLGAGMGITVGMIAYISRPDMPFLLAIYGVAGLFSGLFRDLGKLGSILGFVLGNFIMSFYINGFGISFLDLKELLFSFIVFIVSYPLVKDLLSDFPIKSFGIEREKSYGERIQEMTSTRIKEVSNVFKELGDIFRKVSDKDNIVTGEDISGLIDYVANDVCKNCCLKNFCWKDDFYTTYYDMFNLINVIETHGADAEEKLPEAFKKRCIKIDEVIDSTYRMYDIYKINYMWENKMIENRVLVAEQLDGISKIMEDLMKEIDKKPVFKKDVENAVYASLKSRGVDTLNVVVSELDMEQFEIYIDVNKTFKYENSMEKVKDIVSETVGIPLKGEYISSSFRKKEKERYKFTRANRYGAITKIARDNESFNNVSGDSFTFGEGKSSYFAALSDGMGVGRKANFESNIAISLLEKFVEAGFDKEVTLKTINSILMLKSSDEIFTTLDVSNIDLFTGKLQVIKTGAASTFIKKKDSVKVINSQSLPVGILKDVDYQVYEEYIEDGDFIVMMSDGVLDANENVEDKEKWMMDIIQNIDSFNPQTIANIVIKAAKEACGGKIRDDMTVMVTKVWKVRKDKAA